MPTRDIYHNTFRYWRVSCLDCTDRTLFFLAEWGVGEEIEFGVDVGR